MLKIYTRTGDDGTTGLLYGGRVAKDAPLMQVTGTVDEAQAAMGLDRAEADAGSELDVLLTRLERELYVLMAEITTDSSHRSKLVAGTTLVTESMVAALEEDIEILTTRPYLEPLRVVAGMVYDVESGELDHVVRWRRPD